MGRSTNRWLLYIILMGAWGVRLCELTRQDIWWDEARNIDVALRPLLQVATAPELDIHPPVYFWVLHAWGRIAGISLALEPDQIAYLTRFLSVTAGVTGVALLYALTHMVAKRVDTVAENTSVLPQRSTALLAAAIGAFSPFWLAESQETRMYTLGFAWLMAAAIVFLGILPDLTVALSTQARRRGMIVQLAAFAILSALALTTHYNAVFILVAWYLWWAAYALLGEHGTRLRSLLTVVLTGSVTLLLVSPVAPTALRQIPGYENPNLTVPSVTEYLWQNWQAYIGGYAFSTESMGGLGTVWLVVVLAIFVIGLVVNWFATWPGSVSVFRSRFSFVFFWLAGGLALYYVAVLDRGAFNVRYSSFVSPALYVTLAIAITSWQRLHRALPVAGVVIIFAGFAVGIRADLYDDRFAREDIAGVTRWLRENTGSNDLVLVDQKYPFGFYYDRYTIDVEEEPEGAEEASARYLFVDINDIDKRLNEWAKDAERVFWVQWYESDTDPRRAVSFLLDKEGERLSEEWFHGYSIDWWELEPPTHFELAPAMQTARIQFDQAVQTSETSLPQEPLQPGQKVPIVIRWARAPGGHVDRPLKARVALYDAEGARIAQADKRILNDRHLLPAEWALEDGPLNVYMLEMPEDAAGAYMVRLLVYDADTLEPLSFLDEAGNPVGIEPELGTVQIVGEE